MWLHVLNRPLSKQFHIRLLCVAKRTMCEMARVFVRSVEEEERLQITFRYHPDNQRPPALQRVYNFDRLKTEGLERTITHIATKINQVITRRSKKKNVDVIPAEVRVSLNENGSVISLSEPNMSAWTSGRCMQIEDQLFHVCVNVPTIRKLLLPQPIMVGFPVYAKMDLEFAHPSDCQFTWYRVSSDTTSASPEECDSVSADGAEEQESSATKKQKKTKLTEVKIFDGRSYIPTAEDVGCQLKLECVPVKGEVVGEMASAVSSVAVQENPAVACPFEKRHKFTEHLTSGNCFRLLTYNILADIYADTEFSRDYLFAHCPADMLSIDYRKQLLLKELIGYNADIICLQEVDKKVFERDLCPRLEEVGLSGHLRMKFGEVHEGSAIFFRNDRFELLSQHDIGLVHVLRDDPLYSDLLEKVSQSSMLQEKLFERTSALQVSLLQSTDDPDHTVLVATTHLFFHPRAAHIRIIQAAICLRHIEMMLSQLHQQGLHPAVIFCGDLNSYPESGLHVFLTQKHVSEKNADWYIGGKDEYISGMNLSHNLDLISACGYPRYTNFVAGFAGCLDYIYVDRRSLTVAKVVPLPSHEDVTMFTALPNVVFPSDHLPLVCELEWSKSG